MKKKLNDEMSEESRSILLEALADAQEYWQGGETDGLERKLMDLKEKCDRIVCPAERATVLHE